MFLILKFRIIPKTAHTKDIKRTGEPVKHWQLYTEYTNLVGVIVTDDTFIFGKSEFAALICRKGEGGQEARPQGMLWSAVVSHCGMSGK